MKTCKTCKRDKPLMAFALDSSTFTYSDDCRKCLEQPPREGFFNPRQNAIEWRKNFGSNKVEGVSEKSRALDINDFVNVIPRRK